MMEDRRRPWELLASLDEAIRALNALGVQTSLTHTELKLTNDGSVVLEVNGRLGGFVDSLLCQQQPGGLLRAGIGLALGDDTVVQRELAVLRPDRISYQISLHSESDGRITAIQGVQNVRRWGGIDAVRVLRQPGAQVGVDMGTFGETALVLGTGPTHNYVLGTLRYLQDTIRITRA